MAKASKTVFVGCRLPHGLVIEVNGVKKELKGRNSARVLSNESYGITEIDADYWDAWAKANHASKVVQNGFVFARNDEKSAKAEANEKKKEKTGTEQINADKENGLEAL